MVLTGQSGGCAERAKAQGTRPAWWELGLVAAAACIALALGGANLGVPSLWHDELVHVFTAKSIVETGQANLPSGNPQVSGALFNLILAGFVALFGDGEVAVRAPSVLLAAVNVLLAFGVIRPWLGRPAALIAAFGLAVSPWTVAWSRQTRFYTLQQTLYLLTLWGVWRAGVARGSKAAIGFGVGACVGYALAALTSFHSILFLAPVGVYAFLLGVYERRLKSRWTVFCLVVAALGVLTVLWDLSVMTHEDKATVFARSGLGGELTDSGRPRLLYIHFLWLNLSRGYFVLAAVGFALMVVNRGRRGVFVALAFWTPVLLLTWFVGYRRPRFMFFAFPLYVAAFSYGLHQLARFVAAATRKGAWSWPRGLAAGLVAVFFIRLAWSTASLVGDSIEVARGAHLTLARRQPQWREPCLYVRGHRDGAAVITTTYLPVLYYVGHVDNWYPSRYIWWEREESGLEGLKTVEDLKAFMGAHPRGYFLAERLRFERWEKKKLDADVAWVRANMTRLDEASSPDVTVYAWGI